DAVAHLEAIEQNRLARGLLAWAPLMKGGQTEEFVRRWRAQAEREPEVALRNTLVDVALVFAQLADSLETWKRGLEGLPINESIRRGEVRVETLRGATLKVLKARFPSGLPATLMERVQAETDPSVLDRWLGLVGTASLEVIQAEVAQPEGND